MPAATYIFEDANTAAVEVNFKWRVKAPTDVTAAPPADFPNATYPSGTGQIAANATTRRANIVVNTIPNLTVTGDRYFDVEVYDVTPADATIANPRVRTKIAEDDVSTAPTLTIIYQPTEPAADSPVLDFKSNRQQFGRTFKPGAPQWKAKVGAVRPGTQYSYITVLMMDDQRKASITGSVFTVSGGTPINVDYTGDSPKDGEKTDLISDAAGLRYQIGDRVLWSVPFNTVWRGDVIDNETIEAEMPGRYGESNAHLALATGIYAGRLGPEQ